MKESRWDAGTGAMAGPAPPPRRQGAGGWAARHGAHGGGL